MKSAIISTISFLISTAVKAQSANPVIDSITISFTNPALGFKADLEGLLQWPANPGPYPLVVFIHGSGMGTRYEYSNLFSIFLNKGFAVFSYDKRGVSKSGGDYNGVGPKNSPMMIPLLASDAYEAIEVVRKRPEIDSSAIVLVGASQAGWIIPVVASISRPVSHYVVMYGPTVTVGEEIYYSRFAEEGDSGINKAEELMRSYNGLRGFDPIPYIAALRQKGLWIFGGQDKSIPTDRSIQLLDSLRETAEKPYTIKLYTEAGHGLKNRETGLYEDYVSLMMDWLEKTMEKKGF